MQSFNPQAHGQWWKARAALYEYPGNPPLKPLQHRLADAGAAFLQHMGLAQVFGGDAAQVLALGAANAALIHQLGHGGE